MVSFHTPSGNNAWASGRGPRCWISCDCCTRSFRGRSPVEFAFRSSKDRRFLQRHRCLHMAPYQYKSTTSNIRRPKHPFLVQFFHRAPQDCTFLFCWASSPFGFLLTSCNQLRFARQRPPAPSYESLDVRWCSVDLNCRESTFVHGETWELPRPGPTSSWPAQHLWLVLTCSSNIESWIKLQTTP